MSRIVTNSSANTVYKNYMKNNMSLASSTEKLATGLKINRASDDPGGLGISEQLRGQVKGTGAAIDSLQDANAFMNAVDGFLQTAHDILGRMKEIAVRNGDGSLSPDDQANLLTEWDALSTEFDAQFNATYNTLSITGSKTWINSSEGTTTTDLTVNAVTAPATGTIDIDAVNTAITEVSTERANLGSVQSTVGFQLASQSNYFDNLSSAESVVRNVDMARESTMFARNQILVQSSTAMLAQANASTQNVLSLLR